MKKKDKINSASGDPGLSADEKNTGAEENSPRKGIKTRNKYRRKKKMTKKKLVFLIILICVIAAAVYYIYKLFFVKEDRQAITGTTSYGALNKAVEGSGTTAAADSVTYSLPSTTAAVKGWYVKAGDTVNEGDLLFEQDDSGIDEKIMVLQNGDGSTNGIADYKADIADQQTSLNEYNLELAEYNEDYNALKVTAPYDGYLTYVANVKKGDTVKGGTTLLATIVDDSKMDLTLYFSYEYKKNIYVGMPATVSVASQMLSLNGVVKQISYVERTTDNGMKCFKVVIEVNNPGSLTADTSAAAILTGDDGIKIYAADFKNDTNTFSYAESTNIDAETDGELLLVSAEQYQRIKKGTLLFQIDGTNIDQNITKLKEKIIQAQSKIDKDNSWISSLQDQITDLENSRAEYKRCSEISGKVISASYTQMRNGMYTGSVTIYSMDTMSVSVSFDELDVDYLKEGMPVNVYRTSAEKKISYNATLTYLSLEATSSTTGVSTFQGTITIDSKGELASGVTVYYSIDVGDTTEGVLAPVNALKSTKDGKSYLIVKADKAPDNTIKVDDTDYPKGFYPVSVEAGSSNGRFVYITSGVEKDTTIFLRYMSKAPSNGSKTSDYKNGTNGSNQSTNGAYPSFSGNFGGGQFGGQGGSFGGFGSFSYSTGGSTSGSTRSSSSSSTKRNSSSGNTGGAG